jgi:hypothetical protein
VYVGTEFTARSPEQPWPVDSRAFVPELGPGPLAFVLAPTADLGRLSAKTLLVLAPPGASGPVDYATKASMSADGKVSWNWSHASLRGGVSQVDGLPIASGSNRAGVELRVGSSAGYGLLLGAGEPGLDPTAWAMHRLAVDVRMPDWGWHHRHDRRGEPGDVTMSAMWSDRLPDGTPAALDITSFAQYRWAEWVTGQPGHLTAEVLLPPVATLTDYANPPELSAYLPTTGAHPCALVVAVPKGVTQVLLDGAALRLDRGMAVVSANRCTGGELTVRTKDGRTTYQGPVDTDR